VIGTTLSHYRITAALGAGRMGAVYRATDSTLGRDVAIKVLPPEVASDADRVARFRREAHLLASLNHPHIAAIYGLEEAKGKLFLALELVEGEDLKERLARGAVPLDEALEIALQIAEALEEAHNKGIVHRDLKPANVKLTPDGKVKVLDFGLAKAWAGEGADGRSSPPELSHSPTMTKAGTMAGAILGTAHYMSPEQARGKPVDRRADVWAFGVVVCEMLTGRALFAGDTITDVIAAVVGKEPDLDTLPKGTPAALRRLLSRCLRKDPRTRLPDIGAARLELQDLLAPASTETAAPRPERDEAYRAAQGGGARERVAWVAVTVALAGLSAFLVHRRVTEAPEPRPPAHFVLDTPENLTFPDFSPLAVSSDGRHIAFVALSPDGSRMWIRSLDAPDARMLPGTSGAFGGHFWSPDSTSIAFAAEGELRKLAITGGAVQRICALPREGFEAFRGGVWSRQGTIVFNIGGEHARLYAVSDKGGEARPLTTHDRSREEQGHYWAQFLPDDRQFLFLVESAKEKNRGLFVASLDAPTERRRIRPEFTRFQLVAGRYLLFLQGGTLVAQRFNAEGLVTTGEPVPIASSVASFSQAPSWGSFSASATGRLAWLSSQGNEVRLEWVDRTGRRIGSLGDPRRYGQIVLSPDGRRVAAEIQDADGRYDLWTIDGARGVPSRLTSNPANDRDPVWSPDGREIIFSSDAHGDQDLVRKGLQGLDPPAPLPGGIGQRPGERDIAKEWVREGNTLLHLTLGAERVLWATSLDGSQPPEALVKGFVVDQPHVSPDGRWLAYISTESGRYEVYVQPFRRPGERLRVSANGGGQPRWRGDGKELFYLGLDGALMRVDVRSGATGLELGMPEALVSASTLGAVLEGSDFTDYAVTADGQRFLVKRTVEGREKPRVHVLLDWPSLLSVRSSTLR
jgi:eukaryotic-like serine/threonine-protein kinase